MTVKHLFTRNARNSLKRYFFQDDTHTSAASYESIANHPYYLRVPTTVTVIEGSSVILSCRIENLNDRMVFWIRNSDLQILTAGLVTFTADNRFRVNHENSVDATDWSLLITDVKMEDQGLYEVFGTNPRPHDEQRCLMKTFFVVPDQHRAEDEIEYKFDG